MIWPGASRGLGGGAKKSSKQGSSGRRRYRRALVEQLESRALLAGLPYGAMAGDTGEYMLGDVAVTVVLMESDPALDPHDNSPSARNSPVHNWTPQSIAEVKTKVETAVEWWEDTLDNLPGMRSGLLNFIVDWTYLNNPVRTGYEPIDHVSDDFTLWTPDFLKVVGFQPPSTDLNAVLGQIKAYNDFHRQQVGADWAFTLFVVENKDDADSDQVDEMFLEGGQFRQAFSFAGGYLSILPSQRDPEIYVHEIGHQFWAMDEYLGGSSYTDRRGYYDTQNFNSLEDHPPPFIQTDSIMAGSTKLTNAYASNTTSLSSREMLGWKDSDVDGVFDVLDVPFLLSGIGHYSASEGAYKFQGSTSVDTLPNRNTSGLANDITINQIRLIEASIDNGPWTTVQTLPARTYQTNLDLSIPVPAGQHTIKIRSVDTRTGVMSQEFVGTTSEPAAATASGASGFVYLDSNNNGVWNPSEPSFPGYTVRVFDHTGAPLNFERHVEPSEWPQGTILNNAEPGATLTAVGDGVNESNVRAQSSALIPGAGRVFANKLIITGSTSTTWTSGLSQLPSGRRQLKVAFTSPVSTVSIKAYRGNTSGVSYGRIDAYNAANELIERFTSGSISGSNSALLSVTRAAADIAYVIIGGHITTEVTLDSLQWGAPTTTTTDDRGAYSLPSLPPGNYQVKLESRTGHTITTPQNGIGSAVVTAEQPAGGVNFGIHVAGNIWHNAANPTNVNGDPGNAITPIDALLVVVWLNSQPIGEPLPLTGNPAVSGYIDVNGDRYCTPMDALLVVNALSGGGGGEGELSALAYDGDSGSASAGASSNGEGEQPWTPPQNSEEYFARGPIQFLNVPGSDKPCTCGECLAIRIEELEHAVTASKSEMDSAEFELLATDVSTLRLFRAAVDKLRRV